MQVLGRFFFKLKLHNIYNRDEIVEEKMDSETLMIKISHCQIHNLLSK